MVLWTLRSIEKEKKQDKHFLSNVKNSRQIMTRTLLQNVVLMDILSLACSLGHIEFQEQFFCKVHHLTECCLNLSGSQMKWELHM